MHRVTVQEYRGHGQAPPSTQRDIFTHSYGKTRRDGRAPKHESACRHRPAALLSFLLVSSNLMRVTCVREHSLVLLNTKHVYHEPACRRLLVAPLSFFLVSSNFKQVTCVLTYHLMLLNTKHVLHLGTKRSLA